MTGPRSARSRLREINSVAMRQMDLLLVALAIPATAFVSCSCTQDLPDPPRIAYEDVVDLWATPPRPSEPEAPYYRLGEAPYYVVATYNEASAHSFDHSAAVTIRAWLLLKDGSSVRLDFSPEFPDGCFLVTVLPVGRAMRLPGARTRQAHMRRMPATWRSSSGTSLDSTLTQPHAGMIRPGAPRDSRPTLDSRAPAD
jgi:hypothetical protein